MLSALHVIPRWACVGLNMYMTEPRGARKPCSAEQTMVLPCRSSSPPLFRADGDKLASAGCGTNLPMGFTTLRVETNQLHCYATGRPQQAEPAEAQGLLDRNPVQLLCRALRLAPACYRRFELAARHPDAPLQLSGAAVVVRTKQQPQRSRGDVTFGSAAELGAAMRQCAAAEGLAVHVLPDERGIAICRVDDAVPADTRHVQ